MLLTQSRTKHINTVTHEGKVLIVATVVENGAATLHYTVKQDGFEDSALQNPNGSGWEAFKTLELPNDRVGDASVADMEQAELTDKQGKYLLRSIYDSAALTADAPVQLVSHDGHLYLFRQSTRGTLLVDRFVLDGMTNTLTPQAGSALQTQPPTVRAAQSHEDQQRRPDGIARFAGLPRHAESAFHRANHGALPRTAQPAAEWLVRRDCHPHQ